MKILIFFILLGTIACKSEYKKGEIQFANGNYEEARIHYLKVDTTSEDYHNAKQKLIKIDSIRVRSKFDSATTAYIEGMYDDAKLLFLQIEKGDDYYNDAQSFLLKIDSAESIRKVEREKLEQAKKAEEAVALKKAKAEVRKLFNELLAFKNKSDFHIYGFSAAYKYNRWLKDVQALKNTPEAKRLFFDQGIVVGDLETLGLEYVYSRGQETKYSLWAKKTFSNGIKY